MGESVCAAGDKVFVRTVTLYYVGEVQAVDDRWLTLVEAAWVADTGRFGVAMATGTLAEVECYPADLRVSINLATVVDLVPWRHELPQRSQ